jgi:sterol desaturase/sphingolipid hydroxylase (fatty acid hydroxylase superfamily)
MREGFPAWLTPAIIAIGFFLFLAMETASPLRRRREPRLRRTVRNLAIAGLGLATVELLQIPVLLPVARWTAEKRFGLLGAINATGWPRVLSALLLLDYTLWFWHWMNHRVLFFWRFHSVHHVDRDMDASTALRFHFGELGLSVGFRALQVLALGVDPFSVAVWQTLLFASILFHHSNTRLPIPLERVLVRLIVTPRMHGIHHSDYENETNTNWSSLLSAWDYLHGTIRLDVPQEEIRVGVPAYDDPRRVTLGKILAMPFRRRGTDWVRPDGTISLRRLHGEDGKTRLHP